MNARATFIVCQLSSVIGGEQLKDRSWDNFIRLNSVYKNLSTWKKYLPTYSVFQVGFADLNSSLGRQKFASLRPALVGTNVPILFTLDSQGWYTEKVFIEISN